MQTSPGALGDFKHRYLSCVGGLAWFKRVDRPYVTEHSIPYRVNFLSPSNELSSSSEHPDRSPGTEELQRLSCTTQKCTVAKGVLCMHHLQPLSHRVTF